MNDKHIRELALKAGMIPGPIANTTPVHTWRESTDNPGALERFAELVIKECARLVNDNDFAGSTMGDRILFEYFGVEDGK